MGEKRQKPYSLNANSTPPPVPILYVLVLNIKFCSIPKIYFMLLHPSYLL